ncbi:MAG: fibronectin type III domain-containing protein [Thermodesulfobacteriota bacterium]|nr:fibronectin type III domain-containing protein [Thermodesulfobacteriota bacterium]
MRKEWYDLSVWKIMLFFCFFFLSFQTFCFAADVTLRWDANTETDLAGYKLYYKTDTPGSPYNGTGADQGASPVDIPLGSLSDPNNPEFTITGLDASHIYFLVLTAYDTEENESGYSNEVSTFYISSPQNGFSVNHADHTSFNVAGRGAGGANVEIYSGSTLVGSTTVNADGSWSANVNFTSVTEGAVSLSAKINSLTSNTVSGTLDISAPQISSTPTVTQLTESTAVIEWTSNEPGNSMVQYGTSSSGWGSYALSQNSDNLMSNHSISLTGLSENTTYFFRVGSTDACGNGPTQIPNTTNPSDEYTFSTLQSYPPSMVEFPVINFDNHTIAVTFSKPNMQNATVEANYSFSPSLNFITPGGSDDIIHTGGSTYRLSMASISRNAVFTLTVSSVTDSNGNPVTPSSIKINDNDNDDMADDWEVNNGLSPYMDDSTLDLDGDGYTNYQEYQCGTDPGDGASIPFDIIEALPHHNSGITDSWRVPNNSSFAVFIESANGININQNSINFIINDGNQVYERNLSSNTVRVVKLSDDDDSQVTLLWAVYDRSQDSHANYEFDANVNITIDAYDTNGNVMNQESYDFNVESEAEHDVAHHPSNLPDVSAVDSGDPALGGVYDTGIQVNSGDLEGAMIVYNSAEPVPPAFAPANEIPVIDLPGVNPVGIPMHFQPPTVYDTPVKVFIPCPGYTDVSSLSIYYYNGTSSVLACDADGNTLPAGEGWMVPGSRMDHNNGSPSCIEIQVYHFSGIQPGTSSASVTDGSSGGGDSADGGGCFIGSATFDSRTERHVQILAEFRDKYLLTNGIGRKMVNFYYQKSPPIADYLRRHPGPRKFAEYALIPLTILAYLMLFDRTLLLLLFITFMLITVLYIARCIFIRLEPIGRRPNEFFFRSKGCHQWQ